MKRKLPHQQQPHQNGEHIFGCINLFSKNGMFSANLVLVFFLVLHLQALDAYAQSNPFLEEGIDSRALPLKFTH